MLHAWCTRRSLIFSGSNFFEKFRQCVCLQLVLCSIFPRCRTKRCSVQYIADVGNNECHWKINSVDFRAVSGNESEQKDLKALIWCCQKTQKASARGNSHKSSAGPTSKACLNGHQMMYTIPIWGHSAVHRALSDNPIRFRFYFFTNI